MPHSGQLLWILWLSVLVTALAAWIVAWRYRQRVRALMAAASPPREARPLPPPSPPVRPPTLAANRWAGRWLAGRLVAVSVLVAGLVGLGWTALVLPGEPITVGRFAVATLVTTWPAVVAVGVLFRWSGGRVLAALLGWGLAVYPVLLWRNVDHAPLETLRFLAYQVTALPPVALLFLGARTRAIAPWLLMPILVLVAASAAGVAFLVEHLEQGTRLAVGLAATIGVEPLFVLAAAGPWLVAAWPARILGRALGAGHRRRWFSDLMVSVGGVWAFVLTGQAISLFTAAGPAAFLLLVPLAAIPLVAVGTRRRAAAARLLVLRVFQRDAQVQPLYDAVIERWRLSGPIAMIAGTDLADRTISADDVFAFLAGRLAERFVTTASQVEARLAALGSAPDLDGRFRVDACYCTDATWRSVLEALVARSDAVLMDLRGFGAQHAGCVFELETLAVSARPSRVIVLVDGETDRAAADAAIAGGSVDRFVWIDAPRFDRTVRDQVRAALFAGAG